MIRCKSQKSNCVPIKIFEFPNSPVSILKEPSFYSSLSPKSMSIIRQSNDKILRPWTSKNRLFKLKTSQSFLNKSGTNNLNDCSFLDLKFDDQKNYKSSPLLTTKHTQIKKHENINEKDFAFSISIESFYKLPEKQNKVDQLKKVIKTKKNYRYKKDPMKDWIILDKFTEVIQDYSIKHSKTVVQGPLISPKELPTDINKKKIPFQAHIPIPSLRSSQAASSKSKD
ncbi:hypothetical protein SteCoe_36725 [Stentor coeruleus]|uniref:Uncharacterized protein n=1 Tax=Stentor coeruleus TaxID=5963 RepID=A0A1R2API3_9CILI|nr:hypothetical protein SteCoe_36725 [Stentor coeruleus]